MISWRTTALLALATPVGWAGFVTEAAAQGSATADRAALVALYDATGGAEWVHATNWKTTQPLRRWYGVQTNSRGRVIGLDLEGNGLAGTIPAGLGNLDSLETLELGRNELTGALPASLGELSNLRRVSLWGNAFTGEIPASLRNLSRLEFLNLSGNGLTGPAPAWLGDLRRLWLLWLGGNELTGPVPTGLRNLNRLQSLNLGSNRLTGTVPAWLGDLSELRSLWLGHNELTGPIPTALQDLDHLESLDLSGNGLTGAIPAWLGEMSDLRSLQLADNELTGTIPAALRNLDQLETLNLGGNSLPGAIPTWLGQMSSLRTLRLYNNGLSGTIPSAVRNLDRLETLNLSGNDLTGTIPTWLGELSSLRSLWLRNNELSGVLPTALRNLDELESLNLGGNDVSGAVPLWLGELSNLRRLYLYNNEFTGPLPDAFGRLRDLEDLGISYNPLTGQLPGSLTQLPGVTWLDIRGTALCAPTDAAFLAWLAGVETFRGETCNRAPTAVNAIPAQTLTMPESLAVPVAENFADPDDDALRYTALSSFAAPVAAAVSGHTVWLSARKEGETTVSVTACDPDRRCAAQTMQVKVEPASAASPSDREALEAFYNATGGDAWVHNANWKTSAALDSWHGVTTGPSGRVTGLRLWQNGLTGAIPAALRSLDQLEVLNLGGNSLAGPIPAWLGSVSSLRALSLWGNDLTGPLPAALGNLRDLRVLNLCCNELTGVIPYTLQELGGLEELGLSWNDLVGPIPSWATGLTSLRRLSLARNELTGPIPTGLDALSELRHLSLGPNDLSPGPIPAALGGLVHLEELYLGGTNRTGPIPPELGNLANLRVLSLYGNGLAGAVPDELAGLTNLGHLYLSGNFGLTGPLPPEWELPELKRLDVFLTQSCAPAAWQEELEMIEFEGTVCADEEEAPTVDIAVVYTPSAREAAGGTDAVEAEIDLMIAVTNQAFRDSGIRSRVELVARSETPYTETGVSVTDLRRLRDPEDGHMDEVHAMRERVGADLVHLIPGESDVGGRAQLPGVFGLSNWPGGSFPHEVGHNLGLRHARYEWKGGSSNRLRPDPAYGYVNPTGVKPGARRSTQWRTIMAYVDECEDQFTFCGRVPRFSNPRESYNGERTGVPFNAEPGDTAWGLTGPADAASVIDVTAPVVATWRDRPATPEQATASGQPARRPGGIHAPPPGQPAGLFFDPLFAATAPSAAAAIAPGVPQPDSMSLRRRLVAVDFRQLGETVNELALNLFDDADFIGLVEQTAPTFSGGYVLSGRLAGEDGAMTLVVNGNIVAGRIWTPEATYRISPADGGFHAIQQVDRQQLPPLADPLPRPLPEDDRRDPPRRQ